MKNLIIAIALELLTLAPMPTAIAQFEVKDEEYVLLRSDSQPCA